METTDLQEILPLPTEEALPVAEEAPVSQETKSVKNFWERLDEVFNLSKQTNQNLEEILEQFPNVQKLNQDFKSAIFQPERLSICSNDDAQSNISLGTSQSVAPFSNTQGHVPGEKFSSFRIRLKRPLRNVKSIQLLSAVIPNAIQNIPDDSVFFFYYKIRAVNLAYQGDWNIGSTYTKGSLITYLGNVYALNTTDIASAPSPPDINPSYTLTGQPCNVDRPNYYDLIPENIEYVYLTPTYFYPPDTVSLLPNSQQFFNRTFQNYADLVAALNYCASQNPGNCSIPGDVSFQYNPVLNKIVMIPNPAEITAGYYYLPCGYEDPNIATFMSSQALINFLGIGATTARSFEFHPGYTLNSRLGYTWNGLFQNPFSLSDAFSDLAFQGSLYYYLRRKDPEFLPGPPPAPYLPGWGNNSITFNSYCDLVNTSCVRIYTDFTFGSTQDSLGSLNTESQPVLQGLLSIVPVNASNLGVGFYQNNFSNPLTKIPQNITEIGITLLNDQGQPYLLPNSATVLLELAVDYI